MIKHILLLLSFMLSGCSEQEMAQIEYKSGSSKMQPFSFSTKKESIAPDEIFVSKKLDRSSYKKESKESLSQQEILASKKTGEMSNITEIRKFERHKIDHDNYPDNDPLIKEKFSSDHGPAEVKLEDTKSNNNRKPNFIIEDRFIIVRAEDSLHKIAQEYNLSKDFIIKVNNLKPPYQLEVGQVLKLPHNKNIEQQNLKHDQNLGDDKFEKSDSNLIKNNITPRGASKNSPEIRENKKDLASDFIIPVEGTVICSFGEETEVGTKNEGINFAASAGTEVKAAKEGVVIYASNQLEDYGNLVLIKHDNNVVTTYAHLQKTIVTKGAHVKTGEVIGYVGSTGKVSSPQLHFAIRKGKNLVLDPAAYLPK